MSRSDRSAGKADRTRRRTGDSCGHNARRDPSQGFEEGAPATMEHEAQETQHAMANTSVPDHGEFAARLPDQPILEGGMPRSLFGRALLSK